MKRNESPVDIRFITFSCEGRLPLLGNARIRDEFAKSLARTHQGRTFELFAWVVMPEHVHLLVRPLPRRDLARTLLALKLSFAKTVIARWRRLEAPILARIIDADGNPRFWLKGGGFDRNVRDMAEFCRHVKYIHRNPVEHGLVEHPDGWAWSSLPWWTGKRDGQVECDPPPGSRDWSKWVGYV